MQNIMKVHVQNIVKDRMEMQLQLEKIYKDTNELFEELALLGESWEGPTWENYQMQIANEIENIYGICDSLKQFLRQMEYTEQKYENYNEEIRRLIDSIPI